MSSDTETTGTSIDRATRSAVRWRVPVSDVGTLGLGTRCTLARAMRLASLARMMAPSILASSDRRWGLKAASSRNPPEQMFSTSGPSPTTMSAPLLACRMRSMPSRSAVPGRHGGERVHELGAGTGDHGAMRTAAAGVAPRRTPGRPAGAHTACRRRCVAARAASVSDAARASRMPPGASGADRGTIACAKPEPRRLGQAPLGAVDLAQLAAQADLAARHQVGRRPAGPSPTTPPPAPSPGRPPARCTRTPPATATWTSARPSVEPARRSSTARTWARRPLSTPWAVRRGDGAWLGTTSAWTSTSSGRCPSSTGTTTEPGHADLPVGEEQRAGVGHADEARRRPSRTGPARGCCRSGA